MLHLSLRAPRFAIAVLGAACTPHVQPGRPAAAPAFAELPIVRERGYALVPLSIGTRDSLWFVLDAAAGGSVISPATRDALGIRKQEGTTTVVTGAGGDETFQALELDSIQVGPYVQRSVGVNVIDLTRFQRPESGRRLDGILGNDFLRNFDVVLDLPRSTLRLYRRGASGASALAGLDTLSCVPNLADAPGWIAIDVRVAGTPVRAIVDTGAGRSIFNWVAARRAGLSPDHPSVTKAATATGGLGSATAATYLHRFERVETGGTRFRPSESRIADLPIFKTLGLGERPAAILGTNMIEDRAMTISYSARQLCFAEPVEPPRG